MDLEFASGALAALCNSEQRLTRRWGAKGFAVVAQRLHQLGAIETLDEVAFLPAASVQPAMGDGRIAVRLGDVHLMARVAVPAGTGQGPETREVTLTILELDYLGEEHDNPAKREHAPVSTRLRRRTGQHPEGPPRRTRPVPG
jgi:hypothetical protein